MYEPGTVAMGLGMMQGQVHDLVAQVRSGAVRCVAGNAGFMPGCDDLFMWEGGEVGGRAVNSYRVAVRPHSLIVRKRKVPHIDADALDREPPSVRPPDPGKGRCA